MRLTGRTVGRDGLTLAPTRCHRKENEADFKKQKKNEGRSVGVREEERVAKWHIQAMGKEVSECVNKE